MLDDWEESEEIPLENNYSNTPFDAGGGARSPEAFELLSPTTESLAILANDNPIFHVDALETNAARGHGKVTCASAANNIVIVGTSRGWVIRYDFGQTDSVEMDLNATKAQDASVHMVSIDPSGRHALVSTRSNTAGVNAFYVHVRWKKPVPIAKLKGTAITSVGWNRQQFNEATTREILLGTQTGQLLETVIEEREKREKYLKPLYTLTERTEPFCDIQMEALSSGGTVRRLVMAVTPTRLYLFSGSGTLEAVLAAYVERPPRFTEFPGEIPKTEVHFFGKAHRRAERFAWMAAPGIYHGHLNLSAPHQAVSGGEESYVENKWLLDYASLSGADNSVAVPMSMAVTQFHFLLLYKNTLKAVNRVSQSIVDEERLGVGEDVVSPGDTIVLCTDSAASAFYLFTENCIYEVSAEDEGRDMWRVHLDRKEYATALGYCRNAEQRDCVYAAQADEAFSRQEYNRAATFYAKTTNIATFEEVTLKFVSIGEQDALRTFLLHRLDHLDKEDRAQVTMIATWAAELYLDKINRLLPDSKGLQVTAGDTAKANITSSSSSSAEYESTLEEFRAFLSDCKDVLDESTTVKLLGSYGQVEEMIHFASLKDHHEAVVQHLLQRGQASSALAVLRKPGIPPELIYRFAPDLIMRDPTGTVDMCIARDKSLNPRLLVPTLVRYASMPRPRDAPNEALRYLEFCVHQLHTRDPAIHNLLISLYTKQEDESALLRFIAAGRASRGTDVCYDPKYALRLCLDAGRMRSCVAIYGMMGMHEEAVALALKVDLELAKAEAGRVEDDDDLQKRLWLMIARNVIGEGEGGRESIREAIAFLQDTDGLLKIEDILPFFPDFALIDDFKDAICASLEDYSHQIDDLKREMAEATRGAEHIRNDIGVLSQRYAIVRPDEPCAICSLPVITLSNGRGGRRSAAMQQPPNLYIFPCSHAFHPNCLTAHVLTKVDEAEKNKIHSLKIRISQLVREEMSKPDKAPTHGYPLAADEDGVETIAPPVSELNQKRAALDDAVAGECPFCGEMMVKDIMLPFVSSEEADPEASWRIETKSLLASGVVA